jgi:hypothetical protein
MALRLRPVCKKFCSLRNLERTISLHQVLLRKNSGRELTYVYARFGLYNLWHHVPGLQFTELAILFGLLTLYNVKWQDDLWLVNCKRREKKVVTASFKVFCTKTLRLTIKTLIFEPKSEPRAPSPEFEKLPTLDGDFRYCNIQEMPYNGYVQEDRTVAHR